MAKKKRSNRPKPKPKGAPSAAKPGADLVEPEADADEDDANQADPKRSDAKQSDAEQSDTEHADAEQSEAKQASDNHDGKPSKAKSSDSEPSDATAADRKASSKQADAKQPDADAKPSDAKHSNAEQSEAKHASDNPDRKPSKAKQSEAKQSGANAAGKQTSSKQADVPKATAKKLTKDKARVATAEQAAKASAKPAKIARVPAPEPTFWFGFEVAWAKLVTARVVVFALLALDALLQIRHAPRYGAGDFNVAQLGFLDALGPGRVAYGACQLLIAYLCVLAVFNVATRIVVPIAAVLYAWLYFGSQLDSYQHHYLVALVLGIASFVPWARPADAEPATPVRSWAIRLLLVQLAIMYLWAAISKLDALWLDGTTLGTQITGSMRSLIDGTIGFRAASIMVIVVELVLAATIWIRPARLVAAPLGLLFHLGIVATGFEIGLFAYVMCALYIFVIPDRLWIVLGEVMRPLGGALRRIGDRPGWVAIGAGVVVAIALALIVRLPNALAIAIVSSLFVIALAVRELTRVDSRGGPPAALGYAHVIAIVMWLLVDRATTVAVDYYRFWGGSQRRLGDKAQAEAAYRKLIDIAPSEEVAHFHLGRILLSTERADEGLEVLHDAQRVAPNRARAFVEEARWLAAAGRTPEAIAKARDAVAADASDGEARALLDALTGAKPVPGPRRPPTTDNE